MTDSKIPAIILYVKVPKIGLVKTRLISDTFDAKQAFEFQLAMIKDTLAMLSSITDPFQPIISYYPEKKLNTLKELIFSFADAIPINFLEKIIFISQVGESSGEHFKSAFLKSFELEHISSCIIIGADTPHLHPSVIIDSIEYLQSANRSIIGPSQIGGFYIFGLSNYIDFLESVFTKENEFETLMLLCSQHTFTTKVLPYVFDIDTQKDVFTFYSLLKPIFEINKDLEVTDFLSKPVFSFDFLKQLFKSTNNNS